MKLIRDSEIVFIVRKGIVDLATAMKGGDRTKRIAASSSIEYELARLKNWNGEYTFTDDELRETHNRIWDASNRLSKYF